MIAAGSNFRLGKSGFVDCEKLEAPDGVFGVDAKETEIELQLLEDVRLLGAETALSTAETVGDVGGEDFPQRLFTSAKDAGVSAVLELKEKRGTEGGEAAAKLALKVL